MKTLLAWNAWTKAIVLDMESLQKDPPMGDIYLCFSICSIDKGSNLHSWKNLSQQFPFWDSKWKEATNLFVAFQKLYDHAQVPAWEIWSCNIRYAKMDMRKKIP